MRLRLGLALGLQTYQVSRIRPISRSHASGLKSRAVLADWRGVGKFSRTPYLFYVVVSKAVGFVTCSCTRENKILNGRRRIIVKCEGTKDS